VKVGFKLYKKQRRKKMIKNKTTKEYLSKKGGEKR